MKHNDSTLRFHGRIPHRCVTLSQTIMQHLWEPVADLANFFCQSHSPSVYMFDRGRAPRGRGRRRPRVRAGTPGESQGSEASEPVTKQRRPLTGADEVDGPAAPGQNDQDLKVHNVFPKVTFPPWLHPVKIWLQTVSG